MLGYITLGTNNFEQAADFYDQLLAELGAGRFMESDSFIAWATAPDKPAISIVKPFNGQAASIGNGSMAAILVNTPAEVDSFYNKAIELGAMDEGAAGPRGESGFYAGYFRDLDGNKLNVFCFG
jgi:catechol 2,3-dioxygenase-like lactoylglutathione lyase family enzyme